MNIEVTLRGWLATLLDVPVSTDVPPEPERPDRFVTVERIGGGITDGFIDRPIVAVQCWAGSRTAAGDFAHHVAALLPNFAFEAGIARVTVTTISNFPIDGRARYQVLAALVVKE